MKRIMEAARSFHENHEKLKKYVHTAWRMPLPPWGQFIMGCFYFSIPVVGGYQIMQWAISKSHESIGEKGEKLQIQQVQGMGDQAYIDGQMQKVGAGGFGMGVKLATSDEKDQQRNKKMLEDFFKREARKRGRSQNGVVKDDTNMDA